mgnify:FL=1
MEEQRIYGEIYESPVGALTILAGENGIQAIKFGEDEKVKSAGKASEMTRRAVKELEEYFQGKRKEFTVPCVPEGTDFQKRVWEALTRIPYGVTRTYKEIAVEIGNSRASRAVGMANHKNPVPIIIPCHRVIGSDGRLTGYAGGLGVKEFLLNLERGNCDEN